MGWRYIFENRFDIVPNTEKVIVYMSAVSPKSWESDGQ